MNVRVGLSSTIEKVLKSPASWSFVSVFHFNMHLCELWFRIVGLCILFSFASILFWLFFLLGPWCLLEALLSQMKDWHPITMLGLDYYAILNFTWPVTFHNGLIETLFYRECACSLLFFQVWDLIRSAHEDGPIRDLCMGEMTADLAMKMTSQAASCT
jgi:hypothetical protein